MNLSYDIFYNALYRFLMLISQSLNNIEITKVGISIEIKQYF